MNHARLLMVSAVMLALAACGGGGDAASTANGVSNFDSSASVASNVTVNIDGLTMPAAGQAVEQANESAAAPGNTAPANDSAAPQENQGAQASPDARATEGGNATAGAANGATQGPVTSAGMFQRQRNETNNDPDTRSDSTDAFPWNGNGSTATYGGREIMTTVQPNGDITYRTSTGEVPFDRALDANGNVLNQIVGCVDVGEAQECTFKAAA